MPAGLGPNSTEATTMPNPPPSPPQNFAVSWGNANITLSWTAADTTGTYPVLNYTIYRSLTSGTETFLKVIGNLTTYTDTGLTNGQLYYYKITDFKHRCK